MIKPLLRDDLKLIICATKIDEVIPSQHEKMEAFARSIGAIDDNEFDLYPWLETLNPRIEITS